MCNIDQWKFKSFQNYMLISVSEMPPILVLYCDSILQKNVFRSYQMPNLSFTTMFHTWQNIYAIIVCTNICSDLWLE